jgi:hypothetical protein
MRKASNPSRKPQGSGAPHLLVFGGSGFCFGLALPLLVLLILSAACNRKPVSESLKPMPWNVSVLTDPSPPVEGKATTFHVSLKDQAGQPLTTARVRVELVMPSMDMGKNEIPLDDQGNGSYIGTGSFTMAGPWNVILHAEKNKQQGDQKFEVVVHKQP